MSRTIYVELVASSRIANDLSAGGLFVNDDQLAIQDTCELVVFNDGGQLPLPAHVVYVDGNGGVGLELDGFGPELKAQIEALVEAGETATPVEAPPEPVAEPADAPAAVDLNDVDDSSDDAIDLGIDLGIDPDAAIDLEGEPGADVSERAPEIAAREKPEDRGQSLHERLRGLTLVQQHKRARLGDVAERRLLERMYGKNVWETLLRNPKLTPPEVARIARMGALPRPLIELIVGNGAWLQVPEVRRALLSNPRLGVDQIMRVLRLTSKIELKLAASQTVYPHAVRDAAKRLLKTE